MPDKRLAVKMARAGGISVSRATELQGLIVEIMQDGLMRDGEVRINGFGAMQVVERSRMVWDPKRRRMAQRRVRRVVRFRGKTVEAKCLTHRRRDAEKDN